MPATSPPADRFRLSGRELALIFLFWTSLAVLSSMNRILGARDFGFGRVMSPTGPILMAFIEAWTWAAFTPLIFWLSSRSSLTTSRWVRIPLLLLIGIAIAIAVYLLLDVTRGVIFADAPPRRGGGRGGGTLLMPLRELGRFRFLNQFIVYLAVLATGFAREYFLRDRRQQQQAVQLQAQLAEARLDALRMQINPHFLFNTLNAVSALVERDPAGVRKMIARLSDLLRHTIDSRAADEVTLAEEVAFLQRYIDIMEIRFQGRLNVKTAFDENVMKALVPNLILQPLVENALEHGVSRVAAGQVEIGARRDGRRVVISVRDNGPGVGATSTSGVGLTNTRARLEQLYGVAASLALTAAEGGGTMATIELPYREGRAGG